MKGILKDDMDGMFARWDHSCAVVARYIPVKGSSGGGQYPLL